MTEPDLSAENERLYAAFLAGVAAREAQEHCATLGVHHQIESYFEDFLEGSAVPPPKPSDHGEPSGNMEE